MNHTVFLFVLVLIVLTGVLTIVGGWLALVVVAVSFAASYLLSGLVIPR